MNKPRFRMPVLLASAALLGIGASASTAAADEAQGAELFQQRCASCHNVKTGAGVGPDLRRVVGRTAGTGPFKRYTPALKKSKLLLDAKGLDQFLAAPQRVAPGTTMNIATPRQQDRADLIGYLATLK